MKKLWIIIAAILLLSGCATQKPKTDEINYSGTATSGVWLTYSEINGMLSSEEGFENEFSKVVLNLKEMKIQNIYVHVRAFCDSLYPSEYFPLAKAVSGYDFDVFGYIVEQCHKENIRVHAWINPYRVSTATTDIEMLPNNSPAYKWLRDEKNENDRNVCIAGGIYLNPAQPEVQSLVINGIKEILQKYSVDGIHFDDYFYPTTDPAFDEESYNTYIKGKENPLKLEEWRRCNVNLLISGCYDAIKYINKDIVFSISPTASLKQNYNNLYADVAEWINCGYMDYIIPQLYFGFEYPEDEFKFANLLKEWKNAIKDSKVGLLIGLANYKSVPQLEADKEEWENNYDIISRQVKLCNEDALVQGYVYFSYSSLFSPEEPFLKQRENILNLENKNG